MSAADATHVIVEAGAQAHATTDGPATAVAGGLRVTLLETSGEWSRVRFENGSAYWLASHALRPVGAAPGAAGGVNALVLVGIAMVVLLLLSGVVAVVTRSSDDAATTTTMPTATTGPGGGANPGGGNPSTTLDASGTGSTGAVPQALREWKTADDRSRVEDHLGQPVAFFRNFGSADEEGQPVIDTYIYPESETRLMFADGVFLGADNGPTAPDPDSGGIPDGVTADDFTVGMSSDDVEAKLGQALDSFNLGEGEDAIAEETYESGQGFYSNDRLVWVYVGAVADALDVVEAEKVAATQATTTVPAPPKFAGTGPTGELPVVHTPQVLAAGGRTAGVAGVIATGLTWIYNLVKRGKEVKDTAGLVDTSRMHLELLNAKQYLEAQITQSKEQLNAGGVGDVEKHAIEQLIASCEQLAGQVARIDSTLPKGSSAIDQFLPWYSPSTADTTDFKAGYEELVRQLGGVDRLDAGTKAFLERAQFDWNTLGADARRSLLVSLFRAMVYKECRGAPADGKFDDWYGCINATLNRIRNTDFPPATTIECLDAVKTAREQYEKTHRFTGAQAAIVEPIRSCPVPGIYQQPPVEDYGVYTADIDVVVGTQTSIENIPTCSWTGWGRDCTVLVGEATPVTMRLGPFKTEAEAIKAMCDSFVKGSEHHVPNVAGGARIDTSFGTRLSIDNAPSCPG